MIQGGCNSDVRYTLRFVLGAPRHGRLARVEQSAAATALLAELRAESGLAVGPSSKAHSRGLVGAAIAPGGVVGIDVEYRAPGRRFAEIAFYLMDAPAHDETAAYRMLTFREAYFKAVGDWPHQALLRRTAAEEASAYDIGGAMHVRHQSVDDDFYLTLVWRP